MKKLILSIAIATFTVALYAGDAPCCGAVVKQETAAAPCCGDAKAQTTAGKAAPCSAGNKVATKNSANKQALHSPKAMTLASK